MILRGGARRLCRGLFVGEVAHRNTNTYSYTTFPFVKQWCRRTFCAKAWGERRGAGDREPGTVTTVLSDAAVEVLEEAMGEVRSTYSFLIPKTPEEQAVEDERKKQEAKEREVLVRTMGRDAAALAAHRQSRQSGPNVRMENFVRQIVNKLNEAKYSNEYMRKLDRQNLGRGLAVEGVMDEVKQEMKRSLRRATDKVAYRLLVLQLADDYIAKLKAENRPKEELYAAVVDYNLAVDAAIFSRQSLIIQRQAVGFTTGVYRLIEQHFPIPNKYDLKDFKS
mmetsp:Transcript_5695/g.16162  ORF Transcript_5695/g.16162 Transcript_5695/m.16162 type:complete len:279 (+) Transcript_5695:13-849(+)|eukprot:CAMPEP_0119135772 /NCGR_PEP_ID=MMETSP1310-20130426/20013_1 /TAXON_ID=464262 /ORGANISM="Genus nov. species nov., Strain RCC2339" /LENGTH=278 /DNA_ID=CAMNT_0007126697 /DNA_START=1 /DNA_END=837 /DNA_ORIENTATION=+